MNDFWEVLYITCLITTVKVVYFIYGSLTRIYFVNVSKCHGV